MRLTEDAKFNLSTFINLHLVNHQNLDTPIARVGREMQRILRFFQWKDMGNKLPQVENASAHTGNCGRPGVAVAVDEAQVNLADSATIARVNDWKRLTSASEICIKGKLFMIALPTPITITVPPRRAVYAAVHTLLSTPVHSRTVSGATYSLCPNKLRMARAFP